MKIEITKYYISVLAFCAINIVVAAKDKSNVDSIYLNAFTNLYQLSAMTQNQLSKRQSSLSKMLTLKMEFHILNMKKK